jgi:hypothetical protein
LPILGLLGENVSGNIRARDLSGKVYRNLEGAGRGVGRDSR